MKKKKSYYLDFGVLIIGAMLLLSFPARAQLVAGVSFDFLGDAAAAVTPVLEQIQTATDEAVKYAKEQVSQLKALLSSYFTKRNNVAEKVPGTKSFDEDSSVDIYNPEAVQSAINELFLQYPSNDALDKIAYEKEAQEFYYDTMIEVQTAAKKLEEKLNDLRTEIDNFENEAISPTGGGDGAMSSSDENGNYYNLYLVHKKFNDVLKITEEVMALYSQYYVAHAIYRKVVLPASYEGESEDMASAASIRVFNSNMAFAQFIYTNEDTATDTSSTLQTTQSQTSSSKVQFSVPAAPKVNSLYADSKEEREAIGKISSAQKLLNKALNAHNAIRLLPSYRNIFKQYDMFKQLHAKAVEAVVTSDQCVLDYLGRHYNQPEKVWYGLSAAPSNPIDYDNRRGLSGWAVAAFQVANADKSAGLDTDSFATIDYETNSDSTSLDDINKVSEQVALKDEGDALATPSQEEAFSESVREVELVVWQIGAQAAKILAEDQYSASPVYGQATNPYPLWQDQKNFYNQYIDGKYENMKIYIRNLNLTDVALKIAEIITDIQKDSETKTSIERGLQKLSSYLGQTETNNGINIVEQKQTALSQLDKEEEQALSSYQNTKENLQAQLDEVAAKISELSDEISLADSEASTGKAQVESSYNNMQLMNKRNTASGSTLYAMNQQDFASGEQQAISNTAQASKLRQQLAEYEQIRDQLKEQIEALDKKISLIKEDYLNRKSIAEAEYDAKLQTVSTKVEEPTLMAVVKQLSLGSIGLNNVVSQADNMISEAKDYVVDLIEEARMDMYSLGDGLYDPQNNGVVVKRHKELLDNIKDLPKNQFKHTAILSAGQFGATSIVSLLSSAFYSTIAKDICSSVSCESGDENYFVGATAKKRDFAAPKKPDFEHYPSPRDIIHFDITDYKNIDKTNDGIVTKSSFLEYGGEIPNIWRQMLSDDAFVERGLNLAALLEQGGEDLYFIRGTQYPCRIGKYVIDVNKKRYGSQYMISSSISTKYPKCNDITLYGNKYYTIEDLELDKSVTAIEQKTVPQITPSELGTLLIYSNQQLRFNPTSYDVYERMLELEEEAQEDDNFDYEVSDNVYQKAMYANNQIGNFLHFVDKENSIHKNVDELKLSIDDARTTIKEMLSEMGFEISDDFDLANDSEYNYIRNKLLEYKSNMIGQAVSQISGIDTSNEIVRERYNKVKNTREALIQDNDALINLNNSTQAGSSLSEAILSEKANQEVMEKTQDEGLSAIQEEIDNYEKPLCVAY